MRPDWDSYYYEMAKLVATRATCPRMAVGSVLVKDKKIISTGYNGAPPGEVHCEDVGCLMVKLPHEERAHCKRVVHSEINALNNALINPFGAILYCTHYPCAECTERLMSQGVRDIRSLEKPYNPTDGIIAVGSNPSAFGQPPEQEGLDPSYILNPRAYAHGQESIYGTHEERRTNIEATVSTTGGRCSRPGCSCFDGSERICRDY